MQRFGKRVLFGAAASALSLALVGAVVFTPKSGAAPKPAQKSAQKPAQKSAPTSETALAPAAPLTQSQAKQVTLKKEGSTRFLAIGRPSALRIVGKGAAPEGKIEVSGGKATGQIAVDLSTFTTENGLRDRHMKEKYLEVDKAANKTARLTIQECAVPPDFFNGASATAAGLPFKGTLSLHGEERSVEGSVSLSRDASAIRGDAKFEVKISDYKIAVPSFAGITVAENVQIEVALVGADDAETKARP